MKAVECERATRMGGEQKIKTYIDRVCVSSLLLRRPNKQRVGRVVTKSELQSRLVVETWFVCNNRG